MADFDETFDWVVVGSGAGSVSSALLMKQAGKSVVILEKSPYFGGTTAKSGWSIPQACAAAPKCRKSLKNWP